MKECAVQAVKNKGERFLRNMYVITTLDEIAVIGNLRKSGYAGNGKHLRHETLFAAAEVSAATERLLDEAQKSLPLDHLTAVLFANHSWEWTADETEQFYDILRRLPLSRYCIIGERITNGTVYVSEPL